MFDSYFLNPEWQKQANNLVAQPFKSHFDFDGKAGFVRKGHPRSELACATRRKWCLKLLWVKQIIFRYFMYSFAILMGWHRCVCWMRCWCVAVVTKRTLSELFLVCLLASVFAVCCRNANHSCIALNTVKIAAHSRMSASQRDFLTTWLTEWIWAWLSGKEERGEDGLRGRSIIPLRINYSFKRRLKVRKIRRVISWNSSAWRNSEIRRANLMLFMWPPVALLSWVVKQLISGDKKKNNPCK